MKEKVFMFKVAKLVECVWFLIEEVYQWLFMVEGWYRVWVELFDEDVVHNVVEVFFQQGEMVVFWGDCVEACIVFEWVIDLDSNLVYKDVLMSHCGTFEVVSFGELTKFG